MCSFVLCCVLFLIRTSALVFPFGNNVKSLRQSFVHATRSEDERSSTKRRSKKKKEESAWKPAWRSENARWYILQVYTGQEESVASMLRQALRDRPDVATRVEELVVPIEKVAGVRGKKVTAKSKIVYPGYIFVRIKMNKEIWELFSKAPKVMNFIGIDPGRRNGIGEVMPGYRGDVVPLPLLDEEAEHMLSVVARTHDQIETIAATYAIGDAVAIVAGPHAGERGLIRTVKHGELIVALIGAPTTFNIAIDPQHMRKLTPEETKIALQEKEEATKSVMQRKQDDDFQQDKEIVYGSASQEAQLRARREKKRNKKLATESHQDPRNKIVQQRPSRWEARASGTSTKDEDLLLSLLSDDDESFASVQDQGDEDLSFLDELLDDDTMSSSPPMSESMISSSMMINEKQGNDELLEEEDIEQGTKHPDIFNDNSLFTDDDFANENDDFDQVLMELEKDFEPETAIRSRSKLDNDDIHFLKEDDEDEEFLKNFLSDVDDPLVDSEDDDDEFLRMLGLGDDDDNLASSATQTDIRDDLFADIIIDNDENEDLSSPSLPPSPEAAEGNSLSSMTVPQLKELLKSRGLKVSGRKADLIARLEDAAKER
uniref:SAP domain-containing protein n=1 Tax=Aureoumbra lagunensis TaxID=44058 RepID=A0A7S3JV18_9STRA|mmetsp:Transcript_20921/g.32071  ORF Transcript_20921/g.32071 Transcript_20921/m.32071 type:complete len:601 (+) Transcript_20921:43-1845(+)